MPAIRIEIYLSTQQIEQAKQIAEQWRRDDPDYESGWRGVLSGVAMSAINRRLADHERGEYK